MTCSIESPLLLSHCKTLGTRRELGELNTAGGAEGENPFKFLDLKGEYMANI
jgi:hypothetical protein